MFCIALTLCESRNVVVVCTCNAHECVIFLWNQQKQILLQEFWTKNWVLGWTAPGLNEKGDAGSQEVNIQEHCGGSGTIECSGSWALSWLGLELGSRWPRSQSQASAVHMSAGRLPTLIQSLQREQRADYWHCPDNSVPQLLAEDIFVLSLKPTYTQRRDVSIQVGKILFLKNLISWLITR